MSLLSSLPMQIKKYCLVGSLFFSGFSALIYEICWIRRSSQVFGSTLYAVSAVVALYFAGFAVGNYFFGKRCSRIVYPLRWYALLECSIGLFGALTPFLFSLVDTLYSTLYPLLSQNLFLFMIIRILLIALVLALPCFCMGGTLPLVIHFFTKKQENELMQKKTDRNALPRDDKRPGTSPKNPQSEKNSSRVHQRKPKTPSKPVAHQTNILFSISFLYAINTTGAVLGILFCGFILIPFIGITHAIFLASLISFFLGTGIYFLKFPAYAEESNSRASKLLPGKSDKTFNKTSVRPFLAHNPMLLMGLFFITGCISIGNEMIWTRYISLIIHNTVYTYTITLAVILLGVGIGSLLVSLLARQVYLDFGLLFTLAQIGLGFYIAGLFRIPHRFWTQVLDTQHTMTIIGICAAIMFIPSLLSGISFPLVIRMVVTKNSDIGAATGIMSAYNVGGGICGSLGFAFFLLPLIGLENSLILSSGLSILVGLLGLLFLMKSTPLRYTRIIALCTLMIWMGFIFTNRKNVLADYLAGDKYLLYFKEGLGSFLAVVKDSYNNVTLEINRLWQGTTKKTHQVMAAHVPMFLHQNPQSVCVIGLGTGQTAREFLHWDIHRLVTVDIEELLIEIIKQYFHGSWLNDPRVTFMVEDGSTYLRHTNNKYDIISIEIGQLFRPQCASFYTLEFYQSVINRLASGGLVCQFVPLAFVGRDQFLGIIHTFIQVFPKSVLWYNDSELLLIGSPESPPYLNKQHFAKCLQNPQITNSLTFSYWGGSKNQVRFFEVFTAGFLCGPQKLNELTDDYPLYTKNRPILEYESAVNQANTSDTLIQLVEMLQNQTDSFTIITNAEDTLIKKSHPIRDQNLQNIIAMEYFNRYMATHESQVLSGAYTFNRFNPIILLELGLVCARNNDFQRAEHFFHRVLSLDSSYSQAYNNLGLLQLEKGNIAGAIQFYHLAIHFDSANVNAYLNRGIAWMQKNKTHLAYSDFKKALHINPHSTAAQEMLAILNKKRSPY